MEVSSWQSLRRAIERTTTYRWSANHSSGRPSDGLEYEGHGSQCHSSLETRLTWHCPTILSLSDARTSNGCMQGFEMLIQIWKYLSYIGDIYINPDGNAAAAGSDLLPVPPRLHDSLFERVARSEAHKMRPRKHSKKQCNGARCRYHLQADFFGVRCCTSLVLLLRKDWLRTNNYHVPGLHA